MSGKACTVDQLVAALNSNNAKVIAQIFPYMVIEIGIEIGMNFKSV